MYEWQPCHCGEVNQDSDHVCQQLGVLGLGCLNLVPRVSSIHLLRFTVLEIPVFTPGISLVTYSGMKYRNDYYKLSKYLYEAFSMQKITIVIFLIISNNNIQLCCKQNSPGNVHYAIHVSQVNYVCCLLGFNIPFNHLRSYYHGACL